MAILTVTGVLSVSVQTMQLESPRIIWTSELPAGRYVKIAVRDTGSGIPADVLPRIFDRYFTTKQGPDASGKGGTGVGLAACREIIEAHQGKIRVESTVGVGTSFIIKLPAATSPAAAPSTTPLPKLGIPSSNPANAQ